MQIGLRPWCASFVLAGALASPAPAATFSFESPTYVPGTLSSQDAWSGTTPTTVRVMSSSEIETELTNAGLNTGTTVHGGSQAVLVTGTAGSSSTFRPIAGFGGENRVVMDVWARPLTAGSSGSNVGANLGNIFMTMEDSANVRSAAWRFGYANDVGTIDYATADQPGLWRASGLNWQPDTWYHVAMDVDYAAKTYDFYVDGAKLNADPIPFYTATAGNFDRARIFRGSGQAGMIVDDLAVNLPTAVPEPAGITGLVLLGTASLTARRRRHG